MLRRHYFRGLGACDLQNQTSIKSDAGHSRATDDNRYSDCAGGTNAAVPGYEFAAQ